MTDGDFHGFHFLPPSVHLPPVLQPVHGATAATMVAPVSLAGTVLHLVTAADHAFPLAFGQT